eukprot:TRINITY_DN2535_c0_g1_i1.p1 TRINITY_DN2535_c0_g1~~TRINITY_DN2535_c0_g1_i1.p1  ORF type:complete len:425 (+),score=65.07 TRINITY_DN2535_c0_g1_i1:69-1277(+)
MGDILSICCDCEELSGVDGLLQVGAMGLAPAVQALSYVPLDLVLAGASGALLMHMFGGNRPRFRFNNPKVQNFRPQPVPPPMGYGFTGRKAVLVGINYFRTRSELAGCINDVQRIAQRLHGAYQLLVLTDDQRDPSLQPTRRNIMYALNWLTQGLVVNGKKTIFFHFSGHGSQQEDEDGDEADGYDETICPVDYERMGMISDDELKREFVARIPPGNRLLSIMDCCHSGTVLDLPYYCTAGGGEVVMLGDQMSARNQIPCDAIMISGCADSQTSADVSAVGKQFVELVDTRAGGALTSAFIVATSQNPHQTILSLVNSLRTILASKGFKQVPQISASQPYDISRTVFDLFPPPPGTTVYQPPMGATYPHYPQQQQYQPPPQQPYYYPTQQYASVPNPYQQRR